MDLEANDVAGPDDIIRIFGLVITRQRIRIGLPRQPLHI